MRLNRFTYSDALREKRRTDAEWLVGFGALFIVLTCILFCMIMSGCEVREPRGITPNCGICAKPVKHS